MLARRAEAFEVDDAPRRTTGDDRRARSRTQGTRCEAAPHEHARAPATQPFVAAEGGRWFIARTGYTGEDGFEIMLRRRGSRRLWQELRDAGVRAARSRRARHAAPRGRHEPLRPGHGREGRAAGVGTGLDGGLGARRARFHRPRGAHPTPRRSRPAPLRRSAADGTRKICAAIKRSSATGRDGRNHLRRLLAHPGRLHRVGTGRARTRQTCEVEIRGKPVAARVVRPPFARHGKIRLDP